MNSKPTLLFGLSLALGSIATQLSLLPASAQSVFTNQPPAVRITSPLDGTSFVAPAQVLVTAEATDPDGFVTALEVVIGTTQLTAARQPGPMGPTDGAASFRLEWPNVPAGHYLLAAIAKDNLGSATTSAVVRITVADEVVDPPIVPGFLRREVYLGISGLTLADLTNHERFPDRPDMTDLVDSFETPSNVYENYGVRLTGFLLPPVTGEYTFYLASDDQGALFLSSDEGAVNMRLIAFEPYWAPARSWVGMSMNRPNQENISAPIRLESGRRYYVEALMKEGGGGDNLGVAWQKPGDPTPVDGEPPIPTQYLATFWPGPITNPPPAPHIELIEPQAGRVYAEGEPIKVRAASPVVPPMVNQVEFFADGVKIGDGIEQPPEAIGARVFVFTWSAAAVGTHQLTARATSAQGAVGISEPVLISVLADADDRELHVVGLYSGMSHGSSSANHELGDAAVQVDRPGKRVTLFLSSYEPVLWHLTVDSGTVLERLILGGYYAQSVEGLPPGVDVVFACPGGSPPWLWSDYKVESGRFYRTLYRLHAMTELEVTSFHGVYTAPYPTPILIDAIQNDPRLRSDYPQPTPLSELPDLQFSLDFYGSGQVHSRAYSLGGPTDNGDLLSGHLRLTANGNRSRFYGLDSSGLLELEASSWSRIIAAPDEVVREGWLMGATFDTARERALLVTLSGTGGLYGYSPASGAWSTIASMNNIDLCSLTYHPQFDALFGLEVMRSEYGRPVLDLFSPDGVKTGQMVLPFVPFDLGVSLTKVELVAAGDFLVMLLATAGPPSEEMPRDERIYLIDPRAGQAWLTFRRVGSIPNRPPEAEVVRPQSGQVFQAPAAITLEVRTVDPDGWVPLVEFFADGGKIGEQRMTFIVPPAPGQPQTFSWTWTDAPVGTHSFTAKATDDDDATGDTPPVTCTVIAPELPPIVTMVAPDSFASETPVNGQTNTAAFRIRRAGGVQGALRVWYSIHGSAIPGLDYLAIAGAHADWGNVEIPAGRRTVRLVINPLRDEIAEHVETVWLRLEPAPTLGPIEPYRVGSPASAGVVIFDTDRLVQPPIDAVSAGVLRLSLPGIDGAWYRLECSTNLVDWSPLAEGAATDGYFHYVDTDQGRSPSRFFRVRPCTAPVDSVDD